MTESNFIYYINGVFIISSNTTKELQTTNRR